MEAIRFQLELADGILAICVFLYTIYQFKTGKKESVYWKILGFGFLYSLVWELPAFLFRFLPPGPDWYLDLLKTFSNIFWNGTILLGISLSVQKFRQKLSLPSYSLGIGLFLGMSILNFLMDVSPLYRDWWKDEHFILIRMNPEIQIHWPPYLFWLLASFPFSRIVSKQTSTATNK